jgi:hypothetical protein
VLLQVDKVAQNPSGVEGCKCPKLWGYDAEILAIPSFYFPSLSLTQNRERLPSSRSWQQRVLAVDSE